MKSLFSKIWDFDFYKSNLFSWKWVVIVAIASAFIYPLVEVLLAVGNAGSSFNIFNYIESDKTVAPFSLKEFSIETYFPHLWIAFAMICLFARVASIIHSFVLSEKALGKDKFRKVFLTGFSSFVVGFAATLLFFAGVVGIAYLSGWTLKIEGNPLTYIANSVKAMVDTYIPTLFNVGNKWLAFVLTIFLSGLPLYVVHWLSHKTRFFWLVTHRAHHVMEFLFPTAAPPAFSFDFFIQIPATLVAIITSKLIFTEPLVMEMILWKTAAYTFEVFNHSIVHYRFCLKNPIVRNASRLFGDLGVYHLMHHSAKAEDHTINLSGTPLLFWDRLFGTYRKPYEEAPPLGLTNQPEISWSPFRIIFSGIAQLMYELKHNKDFKTRLKIIFGSIWYMPPITKDFLKVSEVND